MSMHSETIEAHTGRRFEARFSDGRSAISQAVEAELTERGVAIWKAGEAEPLIWPYGALAVAEPLTAHSIDALITYSYQPGASLFVPGGAFARALALVAPQLSARAERWRHTRPWLWLAGAIAVVAGLIAISDFSPANTVAKLLPDSAREALGEQVIASMTSGRETCEAPLGRGALDRLAERLSAAGGGRGQFKLTVYDWGLVNAFAAPGEQIVLTRGLIQNANSPEELAGVIAHEMGHGLEMHPETGIVRALGLSAAAELMLGGNAGTIANLGLVLAQLSYTRAAEREADEHALRILKATSISSKGLADFFERMAKAEGASSGQPGGDLLRTHPQTKERLLRVRREPTYATQPAMSDAEWQALKVICGPPKQG
jgi:Zn-dependent protease with chaperone function